MTSETKEKESHVEVEVIEPQKAKIEQLKDMCMNVDLFWLMVIALALSELLPFIQEAFGFKIEGNGLAHIVLGLLTRDPAQIQSGLKSVVENTEEV